MKAKIISGIVFLIIILMGITYYQFNRSHIDISKQEPVYSISATKLFEQFSADEAKANSKYLGKIIEVKGKIYSIEKGVNEDYNILLMDSDEMFGISCNISSNEINESIKAGQELSIKGECSGMLSDVVLIRCIIIKK